jgi:multiple sugar transport system permease protein
MAQITQAKSLSAAAPGLSLNKRLKLWLGPDWREAYLFMLPAVALLGLVVAYPFLHAFYLGFTRTTSLEVGEFVGLQNYINIWKDPFFRASVRITTIYTASAVALKFVVGMIAALLLHRMKRYSTIFTGLVLLPWIMPEVVRAITWKGLLDPIYGMVSPILKDLGLIEQSIPFLGDPKLALPSVVMVNLWAGIPFFTILMVAGLKAIDKELYEAAAIDGASAWRQFLHITLPGVKYVILVETLLSTIWTFNGFTQVFLLTGGGPVGATKLYSIFAIEASRGFRIGSAVAAAMSMVPFLAILIVILSRYMMAGHTASRVVTEDEQRGPVMQALYLLTWPFRMALALVLKIFWLINDNVELAFEAIGRAVQPLLFGKDQHKSAVRQARFSKRFTAIMAAVVLTLLLVFELFPFYWVFITSFKTNLQNTTFTSIYWPKPWTIEQYEALLGPGRNFVVWYRNTLTVAIITPLISTLVAALGGYGLVRLRWAGRRPLSGIVLVAYLMPGVLMVISIFQIFSKLGLTNNLIGLMVAYATFALPFALWLMMGYYTSIPTELEDAGLIDGCNRFQVFFKIVLPLTKPALMAIFLFGVTSAWHEYLFAYVLVTRESLMTLPVGLGQMIIGDVLPWGELTGASILMAIPVFIIYSAGQKFMVAGLTAGAVKGGG